MRLQEHVAAREASVFVAREHELARLSTFLEPAAVHRLVFLTGPAGSGKSSLMRELARRAPEAGCTVAALDDANDLDRPLVLLDSAEVLALEQRRLREVYLPRLPASARIVVALRGEAEPEWWTSPWAPSLLTLPVPPFDSEAAAAFLAARGVRDSADISRMVGWAEGHALSLTLAASVRESSGRPLTVADLDALEHDLLDHLTGGHLADPDLVYRDRAVLAVAALAPSVDAGLLAAVLPDTPGTEAERWLRSLPFAERLGARVTLHQRVRRLVAAQLRRTDPDLERSLRLRIIDHLSLAESRTHLLMDIREVLAPPQDRGVTPSMALASPWQVDQVSEDDLPALRVLLADRDPTYVAWVLRWVREAPEQVIAVRRPWVGDRVGDLVAIAAWATPGSVPPGLADDPLLERWIDWADGRAGSVLLNPITELWAAPESADEVSAVVLTALVQRCGLPNFTCWVVPRNLPAPDPLHCGGVRAPGLDLDFGDLHLETYVLDYGEGGVIPALHDRARADLAPAVPVEEVRQALRFFHDPLALASSPLARGADPASRADHVSRLIRTAVAEAFGDHADARQHRDVLELGYLEADSGHARAMRVLHMSRTTYFRRLSEATSRLAAWIATPR